MAGRRLLASALVASSALAGETPSLLTDDYLHLAYNFSLEREHMKRRGTGELWLSFADGIPRMRLRGAASSPRFGDGEITVVVDAGTRRMHALFKLGELHEAQCVTYPFPSPEAGRLERLRWRGRQFARWRGRGPLRTRWTREASLELELSGQRVRLELRRGQRPVKRVRLQRLGGPRELFGPPAANCSPASETGDALAEVELVPPHRRSSALNDLLLVLADPDRHWPQPFVVVSAVMVPGDVAVMIEDPAPPRPAALGFVAFDYTAEEVIAPGGALARGRHTSEGSIWLDLASRTFRLRGEARETKVGPLLMDLIADGQAGRVYANVNITVQGEQQCVSYDYPELSANSSERLWEVAQQGLSFFAVSELHGEDCAIFVAPLARGRWIHLWVDMESETPDAIVRSEIHRGGRVLRRTDVLRWRTGQGIGMSVRPAPAWRCREGPGAGQIAHLGLSEMHKRSFELQDALYALRALPRSFAMLEALGLTGDVAMMVQEPDLPELWRLPLVSFTYSMYLGPANGDPIAGEAAYAEGAFAADLRSGRVWISAGAAPPANNVSVALGPGLLSVRVATAAGARCLSMPVDEGLGPARPAAGIFEGVEEVAGAECNRFSFRDSGSRGETVEFWFSRLQDAACRLDVLPPAKQGRQGLGALIDVAEWHGDAAALPGGPEAWNCEPAAEAARPWLSLRAPGAAEDASLPLGLAAAKLAQAAGAVGMLPAGASALARLQVRPPAARPGARGVFGPGLETFGFSFSSRVPRLDAAAHRGSGELRVDLQRRRLYMRSRAENVSGGVGRVESRVIFRGDRGRLYARTEIESEGFEQCWSVRTVEAVPPLQGPPPNPFARGRLAGRGFPMPGGRGKGETEKYVISLSQKKRVEFFVDDRLALAAMHLEDVHRMVSVGILVEDWFTSPIDDGWFEPSNDWKCEDLQFLEYAEQIAEWDLVRVFFPGPGPGAAGAS